MAPRPPPLIVTPYGSDLQLDLDALDHELQSLPDEMYDYDRSLIYSRPRPDTYLPYYQELLHQNMHVRLQPIQMVRERTDLLPFHWDDKRGGTIYARVTEKSTSTDPALDRKQHYSPPPPPSFPTAPIPPPRKTSASSSAGPSTSTPGRPITSPQPQITVRKAIDMLDAPIDIRDPPNTEEVFERFKTWHYEHKWNKNRLCSQILGHDVTSYRSFTVTFIPWNEMQNQRKMFLRMHNWVNFSEEVKAIIWEMDLKLERSKLPGAKEVSVANPLSEEHKEHVLEAMRQSKETNGFVGFQELTELTRAKGMDFSRVLNFYRHVRSHAKQGNRLY